MPCDKCHVIIWWVIPEDAEESHGCGEEDKRRADQDSDLVPINKIQPYGWCWLLVQVQIAVLTTISEATTEPPLPLGMKLIHYHCDDVTCHDVTCVTCPCNPVTADVSDDGTQWLTSPGSHGESRHDTFRCVHRVNSEPSHWPVWLCPASDWSVRLCPGLSLVSAPAPGSEVTWWPSTSSVAVSSVLLSPGRQQTCLTVTARYLIITIPCNHVMTIRKVPFNSDLMS